MGVQTDALLDRPPTPLFVPRPSGVDAVTQVAEGDLFHFDFEVAPVLDVLVGEWSQTIVFRCLQVSTHIMFGRAVQAAECALAALPARCTARRCNGELASLSSHICFSPDCVSHLCRRVCLPLCAIYLPACPSAGKTLESALAEVLQEDELAAIRARQAEFEAVRNAELAEVQRLEAEVRRKAEERSRRLAQERARVAAETDVQKKAAAAAFARSFVAAMRRNVLAHLGDAGYLYDPLRREIETAVLPDIYAALSALADTRDGVAAALADGIVGDALSRGAAQYEEYVARLRAEREAAEAAAKAAAEAAAAAAAAKAEADAAAAAAAAAGEGGAEGDAPETEE